MADSITMEALGTGSVVTVQNAFNFVFWIVMGLVGIGIMAFIAIKLWERFTYKIHVTVRKELGDVHVKDEDWAKKVTDNDGNYFFRYKKLKKYSPVINDKYMVIVKKKLFGLFPNSYRGFDAYLKDGKIIPMVMNKAYAYGERGDLRVEHVSLTGIDYDAFNFLQSQVKSNLAKYTRVDRLMQILPYAGLFLVVIAFIIASALYAKHIETVVERIVGFTQQATATILDKVSGTQVIT